MTQIDALTSRLVALRGGGGGGGNHLDISVHPPLESASKLLAVVACPSSVLSTASARKRTKYHAFNNPARAQRFTPITLSTFGGWHPESRRYFGEVCNAMASTTRSPRHYVHAVVFGRMAAQMVCLKCRALT